MTKIQDRWERDMEGLIDRISFYSESPNEEDRKRAAEWTAGALLDIVREVGRLRARLRKAGLDD